MVNRNCSDTMSITHLPQCSSDMSILLPLVEAMGFEDEDGKLVKIRNITGTLCACSYSKCNVKTVREFEASFRLAAATTQAAMIQSVEIDEKSWSPINLINSELFIFVIFALRLTIRGQ